MRLFISTHAGTGEQVVNQAVIPVLETQNNGPCLAGYLEPERDLELRVSGADGSIAFESTARSDRIGRFFVDIGALTPALRRLPVGGRVTVSSGTSVVTTSIAAMNLSVDWESNRLEGSTTPRSWIGFEAPATVCTDAENRAIMAWPNVRTKADGSFSGNLQPQDGMPFQSLREGGIVVSLRDPQNMLQRVIVRPLGVDAYIGTERMEVIGTPGEAVHVAVERAGQVMVRSNGELGADGRSILYMSDEVSRPWPLRPGDVIRLTSDTGSGELEIDDVFIDSAGGDEFVLGAKPEESVTLRYEYADRPSLVWSLPLDSDGRLRFSLSDVGAEVGDAVGVTAISVLAQRGYENRIIARVELNSDLGLVPVHLPVLVKGR
jgi:hypothetical protein